jgi:hypothetical protein
LGRVEYDLQLTATALRVAKGFENAEPVFAGECLEDGFLSGDIPVG